MSPSTDGQQVGEYVALLLSGAGATQHIVAVALEPLFDFIGAGEAFGVGGGCQRRKEFASGGVLACGRRVAGMAGGAAPFPALRAGIPALALVGGEAGKRRILLFGLGGEPGLKVSRGFSPDAGGSDDQGRDDDKTHGNFQTEVIQDYRVGAEAGPSVTGHTLASGGQVKTVSV
ncbi:MAG TPA: hypothetical protein PLQ56_28645 [Aggregatilineales bacterium]|nr:hypothetical protein [Aggregatilineales bacterium]